MSRRFRFLTNPRIFSFFTEPRMNLVEFFVTFVVASTGLTFLFLHYDSEQDRIRESTLEARVEKARSEVQLLKAEAKRKGTLLSTPASLKVFSETETQTPAGHAPDDNVDTVSDDTGEIVHTAPLKGLPLDVAKAIPKEYTDASIARAKRYHEWDQQWQAHRERDRALVKKELAHGDAVLANSKKFGETYLASFALMSPEALETARKELLKTQPAEEVDSFFTKVKAYGTSKSREQINQEVQDYEKTRETLAIAKRELVAEREQIQREWEELQRTKHLTPYFGLDEFYTEWKKRNSTKPTPP